MYESRRQENRTNNGAHLVFKRLFDQGSLLRLSLIQRIVLEQMRNAEPNQLDDMWAEQFRLVGLHIYDETFRLASEVVREFRRKQSDREPNSADLAPLEPGDSDDA
jgi:hypothetical protein